MGTRADHIINVAIAQLRKDNPEKLKEKPLPSNKVSSKRCGECDAPRGVGGKRYYPKSETFHAADCNNWSGVNGSEDDFFGGR
jgi:hypothetical protein